MHATVLTVVFITGNSLEEELHFKLKWIIASWRLIRWFQEVCFVFVFFFSFTTRVLKVALMIRYPGGGPAVCGEPLSSGTSLLTLCGCWLRWWGCPRPAGLYFWGSCLQTASVIYRRCYHVWPRWPLLWVVLFLSPFCASIQLFFFWLALPAAVYFPFAVIVFTDKLYIYY